MGIPIFTEIYHPALTIFGKKSIMLQEFCRLARPVQELIQMLFYGRISNIPMSFRFILNSVLLGVGLAMDAFSVSLANGLNDPHMPRSRLCLIAGVYAVFQFSMPMIGWFFVRTAAERFTAFQKFIPWIAFLLLLYIGGSMLLEGLHKNDSDAASGVKKLTIGALLMQGVATSIDALSVGFTIESYGVAAAFSAALIIAVVTFIICVCGLVLGRAVGMRYARHASILGGVILIGIGLEIMIEHLFF